MKSVRLIPHLRFLRRLVGTDIDLPFHEAQPDIGFIKPVKGLRHLQAKVSSEVDLSPLSPTRPGAVRLSGAQRFTNLDRLPSIRSRLSLVQGGPWSNLDFLRGRALRHLHFSAVAAGCDLSPLTEVRGLRTLTCTDWPHLGALPALPQLDFVFPGDSKNVPIDVRPLGDRELRLTLHRENAQRGR